MRPSRLLSSFVLPSLLAAGALAQVPDDLRMLVTDPKLSARFREVLPQGTQLFMLPKAYESTRAVLPGDPASARYQFGTADISTTSVTGQQFEPIDDSVLSKDLQGLEFTGGTPPAAVANIDFDNGVLWDGVLWWAQDSSVETMTLDLVELCWPFGPGLPTATILGTGSTVGTGGQQFLFTEIPSPVTVNNALCSYFVTVSATGLDAGNVIFSRGRAGWLRQVSPSPVTATFTDVPTDHPFFRFVEALADSGITAGCGGGNFCPDQPLTRGQMAVFLSVALGLHWPF